MKGILDRMFEDYSYPVEKWFHQLTKRVRYKRFITETLKDYLKRNLVSLVIIVRDTDCRKTAEMKKETDGWFKTLRKKYEEEFPELVYAFPSPHIEKWYLLDMSFWRDKVAESPQPPPRKVCKKDFYKQKLHALCYSLPRRGVEYGSDIGRNLFSGATSAVAEDFRQFLKDIRAKKPFFKAPIRDK